MNKLDYPEALGKIFFRNLEVNFLKEGIDEAFEGLLSAFSDSATPSGGIKLSGCEVTVDGNDYTITSGFVYMLGEVFKVVGHSLNSASVVYLGVQQLDYDTAYNAPIEGGAKHATRKQRRVVLLDTPVDPDQRMSINSPSLETKVMNAAHPTGHPVWLDPRLEGKVMADYFNMIDGIGKVGTRYEGWICLGVYAGTEDYKSRALIVLDKSDSDIDTVGKVYGSKTHTLTAAEIASHAHEHRIRAVAGSGGGVGTGSQGLDYANEYTEENVGDQPHNNMQPSIVAALVCRISDDGYYVP